MIVTLLPRNTLILSLKTPRHKILLECYREQDRPYISTHRFKPLLREAGLPKVRFYDLRHTCATLLPSENVNPKVVSEMLGHATIAITLDTYSHVLPDMQGQRRQGDGRGALVAYCCQSPRLDARGLRFVLSRFAPSCG